MQFAIGSTILSRAHDLQEALTAQPSEGSASDAWHATILEASIGLVHVVGEHVAFIDGVDASSELYEVQTNVLLECARIDASPEASQGDFISAALRMLGELGRLGLTPAPETV